MGSSGISGEKRTADFADFRRLRIPIRPVLDGGRRFRALRLGDPDDLSLLQAI